MEYAVQMQNIKKVFGKFTANDNITLEVKKTEIHALLGENGAGKSTLMNVLFGIYQPDGGEILINEQKVKINNPNDANDLKIGMVHQHFKLIDTFTVTENIILGSEETNRFGAIDRGAANKKVQQIIDSYSFGIDATKKVKDLTVGEQQKVEILKMLYKNSEILIFDEPTGVLTPQETKELLKIMKAMQQQGKTIILITHKLNEIKEVADRCTVIRKGTSIGTVDVKSTDEQEMANMMVGREVNFEVKKEPAKPTTTILDVQNISVVDDAGVNKLQDVSISVRKGEIVGIAGVDGNGQNELVAAITGLTKIKSGKIEYQGVDISSKSIRQRNDAKISVIPQDRHLLGLVLDYNLAENSVLFEYHKQPFSKSGILNKQAIEQHAQMIVEKYDVRSPKGISGSARDLSGGNQQKLIIGREIERNPELLIAVQPTRGVDVGAIESIHRQIIEERDKNVGILLISLELEEVMKVSDRIVVIHDGKIIGEVDPKNTTEEEIGLMMAGKQVENAK